MPININYGAEQQRINSFVPGSAIQTKKWFHVACPHCAEKYGKIYQDVPYDYNEMLFSDLCEQEFEHLGEHYSKDDLRFFSYQCLKCQNIISFSGKERYGIFLKTKTWDWLKHKTLNSFCKRCKDCGKRSKVPHHWSYEDLLNPEFLVPLCEECHTARHSKVSNTEGDNPEATLRYYKNKMEVHT